MNKLADISGDIKTIFQDTHINLRNLRLERNVTR